MHSTLFTNALIFDGHSPDVLTDRYVLVADRRFAAIGSERPDIADADVVDLNGKLIMPG